MKLTSCFHTTSYPGSFQCHHYVSEMSLGTRLVSTDIKEVQAKQSIIMISCILKLTLRLRFEKLKSCHTEQISNCRRFKKLKKLSFRVWQELQEKYYYSIQRKRSAILNTLTETQCWFFLFLNLLKTPQMDEIKRQNKDCLRLSFFSIFLFKTSKDCDFSHPFWKGSCTQDNWFKISED